MPAPAEFHEATLPATPIRDLHLTIAGTPLEPVIAEFGRELERAGVRRVRPHFYLSTEWGVPWGTVAIAIPFYLARLDLTDLHARRGGFVEGAGRTDILRYLRHEMGHVVNYAYELYGQEEWVKLFGDIDRPYVEEYRPQPFSRRFVRHLPGWYAQKHPDEDWAETFAVWMTPGLDWRAEYAGWPEALAKLEYCDRTVRGLADRDPPVTSAELDEDVGELPYSLEDFYRTAAPAEEFPPGLDGALRTVFEEAGTSAEPAAALMRRLERPLSENVYRWTGHFPERTRELLRHLARRAEELKLSYPAGGETEVALGLTTLVTALAMNHVNRGTYW
jgi:Putative zinc-binding metallo-peptidase